MIFVSAGREVSEIEIYRLDMQYVPGTAATSTSTISVNDTFSEVMFRAPIEESSSIRPSYADRLRSFEGSVKGATRLSQAEKGEIAGTTYCGHLNTASGPTPAPAGPAFGTGGFSDLMQRAAFGVEEAQHNGISRNEAERNKVLVSELPDRVMQNNILNPGGRYTGGIQDLFFKLGYPSAETASDGKLAGLGLGEAATGSGPQGGLKHLLLRLGFYPEEMGNMGAKISDNDSMRPEVREMRSTLNHGIKKLLLQWGLFPRDAQEIMERDKTAFAGLSKFFFKSGSPEECSVGGVAEKGFARDFKTFLLTRGIVPGDLEHRFSAGDYGNKPISPRKWMALLHQDVGRVAEGTIPTLTGEEAYNAGAKATGITSDRQECMVSLLAGGQLAAEEKASAGCEQLHVLKSHDGATQKVVEQVVRGIKIQLEHGQAEARIFLHPPSLGKLHMHIVARENQVSATFIAETPHVKEIIESNFPRLRESFLEQGMHVEQFSVFVGNQPSDNQTGGYALSRGEISRHELREVPEREDILRPEHVTGSCSRDHVVDLFI